MKNLKRVMMLFLPVIVVGGLFWPALGYLALAMMAFFLPFSFFKGRYWCGHLCPRGAFLDIVLSKASFARPLPKIFVKMWFRWLVFAVFVGIFVARLIFSDGDLFVIGFIFASMCLLTTIFAVILGIIFKHRGWCAICPMGTLQGNIHRLNRKKQELR